MNYIQGTDRNQTFLFPGTIDEIISEDNSARVIDVFVDNLRLVDLGFSKTKLAHTGRYPYHRGDLLKLYIYGYLNKVRSSRDLAKECQRNLEAIWLLKGVKPKYKTIADFRKDHPKQIRRVFRNFVELCQYWDLFGKEMIAIDSTSFRAVNSKKNNYNQKKIERHLKYIGDKIEEYLEELDKNDTTEKDVPTHTKEEIQNRIKELEDRKKDYKELEKQLKDSDEDQISTTDPDSRLIVKNGQPAKVSYNPQVAVDDKNKLIADYKNTNQNDRKQLSDMSTRSKKVLNTEKLDALADKGYHNAEELHKCEQANITTYVGEPEYRNNKPMPKPGYYKNNFIFNKKENHYICPQGQILTTNGNDYRKPHRSGYTLVKHYKTKACKSCKAKHLCTENKHGRLIERSQYRESVDANHQRIKTEKEKYLQRQMIVEHPFGTIKRNWGYDYVLVKGLKKVDGEFGLIFLCYNLKRVINILGVKELIYRLKACFCKIRKISTILRRFKEQNIFEIFLKTLKTEVLYGLILKPNSINFITLK